MLLKMALCSDIDLENRFKHMTSKKALEYESIQLKNFQEFIRKIIELNVEVLIISGNLFGTSNPKNKTIEMVSKCFKKLSTKGIRVLLLPGSHDTPLYFSNDRPVHFIFESIENISVLHSHELLNRQFTTISGPLFDEKIKNISFEIFGPTTSLLRPDLMKLQLDSKENSYKLFMIPDLFSFKEDAEDIFKNFLEGVKKWKINALLVGGIMPISYNASDFKFQIISCPQFHQNNFNYCNDASGFSIYDLDNGKLEISQINIETSKFKVFNEILDVSQIAPEIINDRIEEIIKEYSNAKFGIFRLTLIGKISKEDYHFIKIFKYAEKGKKLNFHFELYDKIEFIEYAPDIDRFDTIEELEKYTNIIINSLNNADESDIYQKALTLIKNDWNREGN